ncbi:phospho-sugar mutase [Vagococcus sp. BWB3-3]|uniref:Phosphoglucomutase n=1 Tax=Vagococcus allomyrinae TaxID=2794353 RepID=A0A940P9A1_9ENTE|nr:phospho-sugar mutase [Vagococcus allomyrinae]MBP1044104.1 phospho-sugar mutase [Vagococcus allomyrinae]
MTWQQVYKKWQEQPDLPGALKANLAELATNPEQLEDAFYAPLEFGTAGMRGILGAGINRMNVYTVRQATEGLARFIETLDEPAKSRGVVIAYDSRHQSPEFGLEAARVLANHQIKAYVFESLRPTPELSFAVRELNCVAGIMITASHNPAAYNGYKVYGADGGQMPPQDADALTTFVRQIDNPLAIKIAAHSDQSPSEYIEIVGDKIDTTYLENIKSVSIDLELIKEYGKELKLVFTPLHGTGKMLGERALKQAGFEQFILEPAQSIADPDFTTVKSPNPEELSAFEYAIRLGQAEGADLLVATDPDADRLGAAVRLPDGTYQVLTGNQIGALLIQYILTAKQDAGVLPANGAVLKSIVSSEMATAICQKFDVEMINVLTGFKFIAEKIEEFEQTGSHTFIFGFEESYGYLVKSFVRDKDAIQTLLLLAEVAAFYKKKGQTLYDGLQAIFAEYGYFEEKTISVTMAGIEGAAKINALMARARTERATDFGGIAVVATEDFAAQERIFGDGSKESIDLPKANVLKYLLEDGSWVAIRPSGTEPKIKFYIAAKAETQATVSQKVVEITKAIELLIQ